MSGRISELKDIQSELNRLYQDYAGEALYLCRLFTEKYEGRVVKYKPLGRAEQHGIIQQLTEDRGTLMIVVKSLPKSGIDGCFKDIFLHNIKSIGHKSTKSKGGSSDA